MGKRTAVNRRLRLITAIVIGLTMIAARRTDGPTYGCRRGFWPTGGASTAFLGAGTSTFGGQSIPASFSTPGADRGIWLLSDTSAQTYVFDQDISDTSQRFGAGIHVICSIYATQDKVAKNGDDCTISQHDDFVSFCGVPLGVDVRSACPGRACPNCTLLAPPECFVRSAERLHYVLNGGVEFPVALRSAQIPWDFDRDASPQNFMMNTDNSGT